MEKIELLEKEMKEMIFLKEKKEIENSKQNKKKWLFFKRNNNLEKEISELEKKINKLHLDIILLRAKDSKSNTDLRTNIKNELKAYIIQKILNKPESMVVFNEINSIINEIMLEIDFNKNSSDNFEIKAAIKDQMIEKLKDNFEFNEDKNTNTLEAFKK